MSVIGFLLECQDRSQLSAYSWDAKMYEYKITESSKPSDELTDLDQYVFVVRQRVGKFIEVCVHLSN